MNTLKTYINTATLLLLFTGILFSCQKDKPGPVDTAQDDDKQIEKPAKEAPKDPDLDFESGDKIALPILDAYLEAYQYAVTDWTLKRGYDLRDFILMFSIGDTEKTKAAYLVLPPEHGYKGNISDVVETENKPTDGAFVVRMHDPELRKAIQDELQQGDFTDYKNRYMGFRIPENYFSLLTTSSIVNFLIHEGFHSFAQAKSYSNPNRRQGDFRFNIPKDYPHDAESFGLMFAGHKIAELAVQTTDRSQLREYAKMFHVILQRLKANDTSKDKLIENYFIPFQWLEGMTSYITYHAIKGLSFYEKGEEEIPYQTFKANIQAAIDNKTTGTTIQDQDGTRTIEAPYDIMADDSAYLMGVWLYGVLDVLGYDIIKPSKAGASIEEMYKDYLTENNIEIDKVAVLESIKTGLPDFDWEAVTEMGKEYAKLWDNPDSATSSYTINGKLRYKLGHAHTFCQSNRWLDRH